MNKYPIREKEPLNNNKRVLKIMKITLFFLFFGILISYAANSYSQETKLTLNLKSTTIKEVCKEIERKSDYKFVFAGNANEIINKRVNVTVNSQDIEKILDKILSETELSYQILGNQVAVYRDASKLSMSTTKTITSDEITQQDNTQQINGVVTDVNDEPIIGANISVPGTTIGTVTDIDGKYSLRVPRGSVLRFSYIGYVNQDITITNQSVLNIRLSEDNEMLDEVVVIGYGTRQRKSITGAVDQVNSDIFEDKPVSNAMQALQGASANLIIQQKNMNPNDNNMSINIRGVSTMGNNDPLIVIDGLISSTNTLNSLNPNDIDNISVLKDAGSAAIYGSRSANGVILVTTKQGARTDKPIIRFNGLVGYEDPDILYQPVKGWQNAMYRNEANMNIGSAPAFTPQRIRDLYDHQNEEYWYFNEIMQKALKQNYNMSVSGGSENSTYMVSLGYLNQESNFIGDYGMERFNFRTNLSTEFNRFKLSSVMAYSRRNEKTIAGGTGNIIINSSRIPPYYYYQFMQDGKYLINDVIGDDNTMAKLMEGGYEDKDEDNFIGSINLDYRILDGLTARGIVGLDLTQHHRYRRDKKVPLYAAADLLTPVVHINPNTLTEDYNNKRHTLSTQFLLDFNRTFNSLHNVTGLLGVSNESYTFKASRIAWLYTDEDLGLPTTDDSEQDPGNHNSNGSTDQTSISSLFGRAGYNYRDKYYGDVSFRYDGSSKFAEDYRWGFFPSFSAAWRISEENFFEPLKTHIDDLKFRTSYGVLGNQNVANYSYQTVYQMYTNSYVFNNGPVPGTGYTYGNPFLTWEKSANFNVGLDAVFLNNNLFISLDYFNKRTWDILLLLRFLRFLVVQPRWKMQELCKTKDGKQLSTTNSERESFFITLI